MIDFYVHITRVEVVTIDSVPNFGPPLPTNAIFFDESELQAFLLAKCKSFNTMSLLVHNSYTCISDQCRVCRIQIAQIHATYGSST